MTDFEPLMKLLSSSNSTKRDMKKIQRMILDEIKRDIQKSMDLYLFERCFAQINQE